MVILQHTRSMKIRSQINEKKNINNKIIPIISATKSRTWASSLIKIINIASLYILFIPLILLQENDLQTDANPFDIFKVRPLLKLKLSWSQEPTNGLVNRPKLYQQTSENGKKDSCKDRQTASKSSNNDVKNGIVLCCLLLHIFILISFV